MPNKTVLLAFVFAGAQCYAANTSTSLSAVQAKNESQISLISNNFGNLATKNKASIAQINMESAQKINVSNLAKTKVTASNMPNISSGDLVPNQININDLLKQSQQQISQNPNNTDVSLYLSFTSLDKDVIISYAKQAVKYGVPIVLRGFINNSYKDTSAYIRKLREVFPDLTILIDPPAYEKYDVKHVPALVVSKLPTNPVKDGCNSPGDFSKVSGEVSIIAMLDYIRLHSKNPAIASIAANRINDVREKRYFKVD